MASERERASDARMIMRMGRQCEGYEVPVRKAPEDRLAGKVRARLAQRKEGRQPRRGRGGRG